MDARSGEPAGGQVALPRGEQQLGHRHRVQLRAVFELHALAVARQPAVVLRDERPQPRDDLGAAGMDRLAVLGQLAVVDGQHRLVRRHLEQLVALGQHGVSA